MEQIKELTKKLIANSFKELMRQGIFDKITIKMITDNANVIRPTFYNHFHDKYELVEWILVDDILDGVRERLLESKVNEAVKYMFDGFYNDKIYYSKAFEIEGQNGFAHTLLQKLYEIFAEAMESFNLDMSDASDNSAISKEIIAKYHASGLITIIRYGLENSESISVDHLIDSYRYMARHTIYDLVDKKR